MTIRTSHGAVRAEERELRLRVIKSIDVAPGLCAVAGFAPKRGAIGSLSRHFFVELALVRIAMTVGAIREFVGRAVCPGPKPAVAVVFGRKLTRG